MTRCIQWCVCAVFLGTILSCTTVSSYQSWNNTQSESQKADFFLGKAKECFETEIVQKKNVNRIDDVYEFIEIALSVDPWHSESILFSDRVDRYVETQAAENKNHVRALLEKDTLSDKQEYDVIRSLYTSIAFEGMTFENTKLKARTLVIASRVKKIRKERLAEIAVEIAAATKNRTIGSLATEASVLYKELDDIGENDRMTLQYRTAVEDRLAFMISSDMADIRKKIDNRTYGDANKLIKSAEAKIAAVYPHPIPQLQELKYQFYVKWGKALLSVEAYGQACDIAQKAIAIQNVPEARQNLLDAKLKLAETPVKTATAQKAVKKVQEQASAGHDYDAEIQNICSQIDDLLKNGDVTAAWELTSFVSGKVTAKESKTALAKKEKAIIAALKTYYNDGIGAYNDEDYETAAECFKCIVTIKPDYEQAQAYFDRCKTKIKALSGI